MKQFKFSMIFFLLIGLIYSCVGADNEVVGSDLMSKDKKESMDNPTEGKESKIIKGNRLRIERDLNGHQTLLILNSSIIAKVGMSDFYLKVGDIPHKDISVSSVTKQGLVSKNKEDFYFNVKPTEGSTEIDLNIIITEKSGERTNIGTLTLPIEN